MSDYLNTFLIGSWDDLHKYSAAAYHGLKNFLSSLQGGPYSLSEVYDRDGAYRAAGYGCNQSVLLYGTQQCGGSHDDQSAGAADSFCASAQSAFVHLYYFYLHFLFCICAFAAGHPRVGRIDGSDLLSAGTDHQRCGRLAAFE